MNSRDDAKYDEVLIQILVNEQSILGFLSSIFSFLARRTDFYYVPDDPNENMGFPPGVAEELVVKVLRSCDPKNWKPPNGATKPQDINNEIMCSTVAQEVEVVTDVEPDAGPQEEVVGEKTPQSETTESIVGMPLGPPNSSVTISDDDLERNWKILATSTSEDSLKESTNMDTSGTSKIESSVTSTSFSQETFNSSSKLDVTPPLIPSQTNSETYNGAERETYSWSQTIMELDVTVILPPNIKSAKDLKVLINPDSLYVATKQGDTVMIDDKLPYKIKTLESFWSVSGSKLLIHLEKIKERWWERLLKTEDPIDLSKIDCSRPMHELPDDHIAKIQELKWNQEQKMKGLPTSDEIKNIKILKKAWNAEGSPFKGTEFDPSVLRPPTQQ